MSKGEKPSWSVRRRLAPSYVHVYKLTTIIITWIWENKYIVQIIYKKHLILKQKYSNSQSWKISNEWKSVQARSQTSTFFSNEFKPEDLVSAPHLDIFNIIEKISICMISLSIIMIELKIIKYNNFLLTKKLKIMNSANKAKITI